MSLRTRREVILRRESLGRLLDALISMGLVLVMSRWAAAQVVNGSESIEKSTSKRVYGTAKGGNSTIQPSVDITVRGRASESKQLRDSADAVTVVDTQRARGQTRDLGDVLAGIEGISVRRTGDWGPRRIFH